MPDRNSKNTSPRPDTATSGRRVEGGRQPTKQNPKPTGPVNIGKPINQGKDK